MLRPNEEVGVVFGAQPPLSLPEFAFIHKERKLGVLISIWHSLNNLGFPFLGCLDDDLANELERAHQCLWY